MGFEVMTTHSTAMLATGEGMAIGYGKPAKDQDI